MRLFIFKMRFLASLVCIFLLSNVFMSSVIAQTPWYMTGANPERTSYVPDAMPKQTYNTKWATPIEAHIPQKVQPVVAGGKVIVATSKGVVALNHLNGSKVWSFGTELPIGNSPSIDISTNTVYAPGLDHHLYALNLNTGVKLWHFKAGAGFTTNPLIINDTHTSNQLVIVLGNRDGKLYAINGNGTLKWSYTIGGPITQSAAYKNGVVYVGGANGKAYAVNISNGSLKWQSAQLPTASFDSWWPVIYRDTVVFAGNPPYGMPSEIKAPGALFFPSAPQDVIYRDFIWPNYLDATNPAINTDTIARLFNDSSGHNWTNGTPYFDLTLADNTNPSGSFTSPVDAIFANPQTQHVRAYFVLDLNTGVEKTYTASGKTFYAPIMTTGDNSGSRLYPIVTGTNGPNGTNDVLYYHGTKAAKGTAFPQAGILGWSPSHPALASINHHKVPGGNGAFPNDESIGMSAAGTMVFWSMIEDRHLGATDIGVPMQETGDAIITTSLNPGTAIVNGQTVERQWRFTDNGEKAWKVSGYDAELDKYIWQLTPSATELYYNHRETPGPAIYDGLIFVNRANAIIALAPGPDPAPGAKKSKVPIDTNLAPPPTVRTPGELQTILASEVQKILDAGHLKFSTMPLGLLSSTLHRQDGDGVYFYSSPFDTQVILARALPHLTSEMQQQVKNYLIQENTNFPIYDTTSVGNAVGTRREHYPAPPELGTRTSSKFTLAFNALKSSSCNDPFGQDTCYIGWKYAPYNLYTMYIYYRDIDTSKTPTQILGFLNTALEQSGGDGIKNGNPAGITVKELFDPAVSLRYPTASKDYEHPHMYNAYIAGLYGYKGLLELAGQQGTSEWNTVNTRLNNLLTERVATFHWDITHGANDGYDKYYYTNLVSWNFMHMVPELAAYLRVSLNNTDPVDGRDAVINDYAERFPYWFVPLNSEAQGEGTAGIPHHYHDLFLAKAWMQDASYDELVKYIDAPGYKVGDMYYIDQLVVALDAACTTNCPSPQPLPSPGTSPSPPPSGDVNGDGAVDFQDIELVIQNFGKTSNFGNSDINGDGKVNIYDYSMVVSDFGN